MADQDNRTEQPTARRLEKAREKGQIPQSQELGSAATLVCLLGAAVLAGPWFVEWADEKVREGVSCRTEALSSLPAFTAFMHERIVESMMIMAPFLLALTVGGTAAAILMGGLNFTPSALAPKLDQLNPVSGFKNCSQSSRSSNWASPSSS